MNFRSVRAALAVAAMIMIIALGGADGARPIARAPAPAPAPHTTTDTDKALKLLTYLGYIASGLVYLFPLTTAGKDSTPYMVGLFSYSVWAYYGVLRGSVVLMVNNFLGTTFQIGYIVIFFRYSDIPARLRIVYTMSTAAAMCIVIFVALQSIEAIPGSFRVVVVLWIAIAGSVMLSASSIPAVRRGCRDRNVEHIPLSQICVTGLSHVPWAIYAVLAHTLPLMYPRLFGFFLGVVQVIVYIVVLCRDPEITERTLLDTVELTPPETMEQTRPETSELTRPETSEQTLPETSELTRPEISELTPSETTELTRPETTELTLSENTIEPSRPETIVQRSPSENVEPHPSETSESTPSETSESTPSETSEPPPQTT